MDKKKHLWKLLGGAGCWLDVGWYLCSTFRKRGPRHDVFVMLYLVQCHFLKICCFYRRQFSTPPCNPNNNDDSEAVVSRNQASPCRAKRPWKWWELWMIALRFPVVIRLEFPSGCTSGIRCAAVRRGFGVCFLSLGNHWGGMTKYTTYVPNDYGKETGVAKQKQEIGKGFEDLKLEWELCVFVLFDKNGVDRKSPDGLKQFRIWTWTCFWVGGTRFAQLWASVWFNADGKTFFRGMLWGWCVQSFVVASWVAY